MPRALHVLITCEHGGNRIPSAYRPLFAGWQSLLDSHRAYDMGALDVARDCVRRLQPAWPVELVVATTSRLVVDLNRSIAHHRLHGEPVRRLDARARAAIIARHYDPYRRRVQRAVEQATGGGARVAHVSCHSFTPSLDGRQRGADIGLLYDPRRANEQRLARAWRAALLEAQPALRVRLNYPYRGTADGLTTSLRRRFRERDYAGIELEVNQAFPAGPSAVWRALRFALALSLAGALERFCGRSANLTDPETRAMPRRPIPSMVAALRKR